MPISDWVTCYSSLSPLYFHLLEALNIFLDACYEGCPLTVPIVGWLLHKKKDIHCQTPPTQNESFTPAFNSPSSVRTKC